LTIYNSLTHRLETFQPLAGQGGPVLFYSCGPTVYDYSHIGNFRSFLNADLLRRTLELLGHKVRHVMNMTDVGHMTEDDLLDGGGEDKMAAAARRLREAKAQGDWPQDAGDLDPADPRSIAEYYIHAFQRDARMLGVKVAIEAQSDPSLMPRPTQYIAQMIGMIESLIARGHAYIAADGVVYFDVQSFPEYGRLSGNTPEKIRSGQGGRVSAADQQTKRHPADFLLWKADPKHLMRWPSPWGEGYPGWHIECSVMARALLGEEIDIHSGGEDNLFPHHDCEIAQTCGATGRTHFARYWFHTRHLMVEGEKMSKSLGNFYTVRDLLARGGTPAAIRLALTSTHYRSNANFTMQGLRDAQRRYDRWKRVDQLLQNFESNEQSSGFDGFARAKDEVISALCDDLNVSLALASIDIACADFLAWLAAMPSETLRHSQTGQRLRRTERAAFHDSVRVLLGDILFQDPASGPTEIDVQVEQRLAARAAARASKDFAAADRIRTELREMGVEIMDTPEGTTWERVVQ